MLEYTKLILQKVSFDRFLFLRELKKAMNWLTPEEVIALYNWLKSNFDDLYTDEIRLLYNEIRSKD